MTYRIKHSIYSTPAFGGERTLLSSLERTQTAQELRELIGETCMAAQRVYGHGSRLEYSDDIFTANAGRLLIEGTISWETVKP
jgi:hypothetical protein